MARLIKHLKNQLKFKGLVRALGNKQEATVQLTALGKPAGGGNNRQFPRLTLLIIWGF